MAHITANRVLQTTTTTGTGALALSGTPTGFQSFSDAMSDADTCYYALQDDSSGDWEIGVGTYSSNPLPVGDTLTRTTVLNSSNSNSAVNLTAGTKQVFISIPASKTVAADVSGSVNLGAMSSNNVHITGGSVSGITDISVSDGGTGSSTAAGARTNLGLGTIATQDANNVTITGGSVTGMGAIGGTTGTFSSTLGVTGVSTLTGRVGIGGSTITDSHLLNIQGSTASDNVGVVFNKINSTAQIWAINNTGSLNFNNFTSTLVPLQITSNNETTFKPSSSNASLAVKVGSINSDSIRLEAGGTTSTYLESRGYLGHSWYVDTTRKATLDATGLGVGVDSPQALIHAQAADGAVGGAIKYTADSVASGYLSASTDGTVLATDTADITFRLGVTGNDPTDTGAEAVRIKSTGMGVLCSPSAPFAVASTASTYEGMELITPSGDGSGKFQFGVHDLGGSAGRGIEFRRGGSDGFDTLSLAINNAGYLGVACADPNYPFTVQTSSNHRFFIRDSSTSTGSEIQLQAGNDADSATTNLKISASRYFLENGDLGLGLAPTVTMHSNNSKYFQLQNNVFHWSRSTGSYQSSNFYYDSSDSGAFATNGYGLLHSQNISGGAYYWSITTASNSGGAGVTASLSTKMYLDSTGLGLGTVSPDTLLHVESASASDLIKVEGTGTDSNPNIQIVNDARAYNLQVVGARSDAFEIWDRTAGATRLTVDTSGQVGVGLTPSYTLDVQAVGSSFNPARFSGHSASIDTFIYTDTNYWGFGDAASYGGNLWGGHKGNNELYAYVNGANVLTIEQDSTDVKTTIGRGQAHNGKAMLVLTSTTSTDEGGEIQFHKNSATTCEIGHESAVLNSGFSSDLFLASDGNIDFAAGGTTQRMTLASTGLDVNGIANGNSAFKVTNASGNKTSEFEISGSGHGAMKVRASNGVEKISLSAYENSHISAGFNMGFGTLSPFGIVDIAASGRNAAGDISDVDDYALVIRCSSTTNEGNGIAFANDDGSVVGGSIIHQDKGSANTGDLVFHTRDTGGNVDEAMRINNSQQTEVKQLGIGIANPTRLLHLSSTGGTFARFTSENTDDFSIGANTNGFAVYNETDSNYPLVITHDGRYGFGTASPVVQIGAHFVPSVGTESYMNAQSGYYVGLHPNSANESQHIDAHSNGAGTSSIYIGNEVIQTSSDIRAKKNITDYSESALSVLDKARVVEFEYRPEVINDESEYGPASRGKYVGLIAQEMIEYARWAVNDGDGDPDGEHIWTAKYELMVPLLIKAVQELTQRVTELENN